MLIFNRPAFKTGTMVVWVVVEGSRYNFSLTPEDKGHAVDFGICRDAILSKYPAFFTLPISE